MVDDRPAPDAPTVPGVDFAPVLLSALTKMATRSQRRQADLTAALRGAGLEFDRRRVQVALGRQQAQGCITNLVPLSDGGLLLTVTNQALDSAAAPSSWLTPDELDVAPPGPRPTGADEPASAADTEPVASDYRDMFEHAIEGIYRSALDGRPLRANPALARLNGYRSEAEMLAYGRNIAAEWYVESGRRDEFLRLLMATGRVENFVSEVRRHRTRERIWVSENALLVRDPGTGEPLYCEGTVREVPAADALVAAIQRA
jgi:PAS domain S-box-containing protein